VYSLFSTCYIKLTAILIISGEEKPLGKDIDTSKKSKLNLNVVRKELINQYLNPLSMPIWVVH
jgi:hypothetical protein